MSKHDDNTSHTLFNTYVKPHSLQVGGRTFCKGICERIKSPKPNWGKDPYETHSYCRKCGGVWMKKEDVSQGVRCPCCNFKVANKSRKSKALGVKKKAYI
jgi:DNA-directed RNA polymerase subunit RPC12/RpoP